MWQLKKNAPPFEVVDGELAGRCFVHGQQYSAIPMADQARFEKVAAPPTVPAHPVKKVTVEEPGDAQ